jgi:glycosyltransferase involved in cell wall biosynthesis
LAFFVNAEKAVHIADALFCRIGMALADEVWVDSYATLRTRLPKLQKRTRIISFVTAPQPPPSATAKLRPRFVSWSRLNRQKGIDRALHFIAGLSEAGVEPNYEIWGPDGGELQHLKTLTDQLGIGRHVSFCGTAQQESLARIAAEASFFLQLSRFEGMAMAVVEAMQFGLVPIVTAVGEIPRYVADGISGIIVDADDPQVGVQRTVRLLGDEADFQRLRQGALAFWRDAPLYADDVYRAAADLAGRGQTIDPASASG